MRASGLRPATAASWIWPPYSGDGTAVSRPSTMARAASASGATEARTSSETAPAASGTGAWPRPSLMWQDWQARALNSGPRPSDAWVEDGADTQSLRKRPLPREKLCWPSKSRLAEKSEKALLSRRGSTVEAPACLASKGSAREKSVVGAVTRATRSMSFAESRCGRAGPAPPLLRRPARDTGLEPGISASSLP